MQRKPSQKMYFFDIDALEVQHKIRCILWKLESDHYGRLWCQNGVQKDSQNDQETNIAKRVDLLLFTTLWHHFDPHRSMQNLLKN